MASKDPSGHFAFLLAAGRELDANGLMYYRARYYAPDQARFISEDSYGFGGGGDPNFYAYVGGNP